MKFIFRQGHALMVCRTRSDGELDEAEERRTRDFMTKYMANYRAHRKGMTPEEVADYYTVWADTNKYEEVIS